ncbi:MAG: hypothetical protein HYZ57_04585 [Acidobacteria bacterium]|nr:hypothetical protein [Acidobacteriota bacterium]
MAQNGGPAGFDPDNVFAALIDRQDRPTIERELSALLDDDQKPQPSEVDFPHDTPLANGEWVFSGTGPKRAH